MPTLNIINQSHLIKLNILLLLQKIRSFRITLYIFVIAFCTVFCTKVQAEKSKHHKDLGSNNISQEQKFQTYWKKGQAEISSYTLHQSRYKEIRPNARKVLIFVIEPFSLSKQVKADPPYNFNNDTISVLKLNQIDTFVTGVYDYSLMTSVFTPIDDKHIKIPLKVTFSAQDWCGQSFIQINKQKKQYHLQQFSYFMSKGDIQENIPSSTILEDALFNIIRINPNHLPIGPLQILPSQKILRLDHLQNKPYKAITSIHKSSQVTEIKYFQKRSINTYKIEYPKLKRQTLIHYQQEFPHVIEGIEEQILDHKQKPIKKLSTVAIRIKTAMLDYWNKNSIIDNKLRQQFKL